MLEEGPDAPADTCVKPLPLFETLSPEEMEKRLEKIKEELANTDWPSIPSPIQHLDRTCGFNGPWMC